jgi:hypothetical protein
MQAKVINEGPERTIVLIFDAGYEVIDDIERFAADPVSGLLLISIGESDE